MVICPRCGIEQEVGKEFCGTCGSFLLIDEEPSPQTINIEVQPICPICQDLHHKGNYCKKCGSQLMQGTPQRVTNLQPLEKKSIKKRSKEWLKLFKEKRELEICLRKLETQKGKISSEMFNPLLAHYQDRLKELSSLHEEIGAELDSVRRRAMEKIDILKKELRPIQKRLEEFRFLYRQGGLIKTDFHREKHEMNRGIQPRVKSLKAFRKIISLLPREMDGSVASQGLSETLFRPLTLLTVCGIMILMGTVGFFLWQRQSHSNRVVSKEIIAFPSTPSSSKSARTIFTDQEAERIKSLFETVRQANLQQNIDLFMTCFSRDFSGREKKRLDALKTWDYFNYLSLSYDLKKQMISGDTAIVRLEWLIRTSEKVNGKLQENRILLDATLTKENWSWKIQEIKPAS